MIAEVLSYGSDTLRPFRPLVLLLTLLIAGSTHGQNDGYLSTGEAVGIGAASVAVFELGHLIKRANADTAPRWIKPPGFDEKISRFFGRQPGLGRQNVLDSRFGSLVTSGSASLMLLATDLSHPRREKRKDVWQNQFLFYGGVLATKGVTDIFKGLIARQRPLQYCAPELAARRTNPDRAEDHYSFFSGHTSSAFFALTFLNKRVRAAMRQEMSPDEYRTARWVPSALCYGWATLVGFSRIQAYRHYLTDVAAGALAGYLIGELYYSLSDDVVVSNSDGASPLYVQLRIRF